MKYVALFLFFLFPAAANAVTPGQKGVDEVHHCIMENDPAYCHSILTPDSLSYFDRFTSYKLMPCLPTDFTYVSEEPAGDNIMARVSMPEGPGKAYVARLVFVNSPDGNPKLSLPLSFRRGLGENWENNLQLSEQLYLMMKQNMGDKLTCDMLNDLVKPTR